VLLFWFGGGPFAWVYAMVTFALMTTGLRGTSLWIAYIGIGWTLILLSYVVSESSIHSMRRRDLTFATTKRSN
jgi:hypothetical protein